VDEWRGRPLVLPHDDGVGAVPAAHGDCQVRGR
jgi:hypothetical protein